MFVNTHRRPAWYRLAVSIPLKSIFICFSHHVIRMLYSMSWSFLFSLCPHLHSSLFPTSYVFSFSPLWPSSFLLGSPAHVSPPTANHNITLVASENLPIAGSRTLKSAILTCHFPLFSCRHISSHTLKAKLLRLQLSSLQQFFKLCLTTFSVSLSRRWNWYFCDIGNFSIFTVKRAGFPFFLLFLPMLNMQHYKI